MISYPLLKRAGAAFVCAALTIPSAMAISIDIPADAGDREVREDGTMVWIGQQTIRIGGGDVENDRDGVGVFFFELPELAPNEFISSASLTVGLVKIQSFEHNLVPDGEVDVYGLGYRSTATPLAEDYYSGPLDPDATLLQSSFITFFSPEKINLTTTADTEFANFLNSLYSAGATAGDFAVFRLNHDVEDEINNRFYELASANNTTYVNLRPYLTITTVPEPSTTAALLGLGVLGFCIVRRRK